MDVERARPGAQHALGLPARPRHLLRLARAARPRSADGAIRRPHRVRRRAQGQRRRDVERRPAVGRDPHGAPAPRRRAAPARRPDDRPRGRPGAVGDPQAADRGPGHEPAGGGRRQRRRSTVAISPCWSCCTRPGPGSPRPSASRWATSTSTSVSCGCTARAPRSASCRTAVRRPAALEAWFSPDGRGRAGAAAVASARRRRGGVPEPAWWAAQPSGSMDGREEVRRSGQGSRPICRRTCSATRARHTCSTTAPTCASSRRCSATPRSRPPRCTPASARSGCGTSTAAPTRGR